MGPAYSEILQGNLERIFSTFSVADLAALLPANRDGESCTFNAFGETCRLRPGAILLDGRDDPDPRAIIISLYALRARPDACVLEPFRAFREFSGSMPYAGAFAKNVEHILTDHVTAIRSHTGGILRLLGGVETPASTGGDFSLIVFPLPKVALCYIMYEADDEFPASVTCLFSHNAPVFLPTDGLADLGEYTSKKILSLVE